VLGGVKTVGRWRQHVAVDEHLVAHGWSTLWPVAVMAACKDSVVSDTARAAQFHRCVVAGDAEAIEAMLAWILGAVRRRVGRSGGRLDPFFVDEGIDDALMRYLREPRAFEPSRGSLLGWLTVCATNRARDLRRSERRRQLRQAIIGSQLACLGRTDRLEEDGAAHRAKRLSDYRAFLLELTRTPTERAFVVARLEGSSLAVQAAALGVESSDFTYCRREVGRRWDLLRRRLRWRRRESVGAVLAETVLEERDQKFESRCCARPAQAKGTT
jgi:DNA-directed RNA polymerase specialized sigma24 family protein